MPEFKTETGLALRVDELRRIADGLGRNPSIVEVHAFDAQWSEHCSYKSSRRHLKKLPTQSPDVVLGPGEDAGIVRLGEFNGEKYCIVVAHESHNHPSQVVPFEGAATGVGGIVRDVLCMGAEVIGIADSLRFGDVSDPGSHQRYVARGVVDGIAAYGNAIGVPNIVGDVYFHEGFNDNCLVNVIALGLVKESEIIHSYAPPGAAGWDIVLVGKATDASGFGGASFASLTLDAAQAEANKAAVQVPDPFLENVIMRASYRVFEYLRERKISAAFKDLGAGGIMGCTAELCGNGGFGAIIDLEDVNTAVDNLPPHVIAVGETQERLCWVLPGDVTLDVLRIYNEEFSLPEIARGARACVIGAVQDEKRYVMRSGNEIVMDVPVDFLIGSIEDELPAKKTSPSVYRTFHFGPRPPPPTLTETFRRAFSDWSQCSRRPIFKEYDGVVRGATVVARGASDAGVIAAAHGSRLGIALSVAGNPWLSEADPAIGAELAVCEAVRKVSAVGARAVALTDCLNFGNPNDPVQNGEFIEAINGLALAGRGLGLPFVSGNVSLYNESRSIWIPGSPIVSCVGIVDDLSLVVTSDLKSAGSALYFIGSKQMDFFGDMNYELERSQNALVLKAIADGVVRSCRSNAFGVLTTAAIMAFGAKEKGRNLGVRLESSITEGARGYCLEVSDAKYFEKVDVPGATISNVGAVIEDPEIVVGKDRVSVSEVWETWDAPLTEVFA